MKSIIRLLLLLSPLLCLSQKQLSGIVLSDKNLPLEGAVVKVKNTARNTFTDYNGNFKLDLPKGKNIIVVNFLGYEQQEIIIENQQEIRIQLQEKTENIKEIVVIGYGEVKRKDATGSISTVKITDASVNQAIGVESLLQGKVSGVIVNSQGFEPNSPISIQIRGINTLSGNSQPLYVVDGIVVNSATETEINPLSNGSGYLAAQNGLQGINPRDIESIEVLKDASATAIYGSRGSNGVILITTKKGKNGKAKFNYYSNIKVGELVRPIKVLNGTEYALYQNKSRELKGFAPNFIIDENGNVFDAATNDLLTPVDWSKEMYKTSISYTHRLNVSGGNENNTYYFSAGHLLNDGITPKAYLKQTDLTLNLTNKLTNKLKLSSKIAITNSKSSGGKGTDNLGGSNNSFVSQVISAAPFLGYNSNFYGDPTLDASNSLDGPNAWITDYDDIANEIRGLGALNLEYIINNIFKFRSLIGLDYRNKKRQLWYGTSIQRGAQANGEAGLTTIDRFKYNIDNTLMFNKRINKSNNINGTVGMVIENTNTTLTAFQASDFAIKDLRANGISTGQVYNPLAYDKFPESLVSFIGRVNYNLLNRYNFTATFRADGSSKFSNENKFSYFPSFAFAWQINKEKFLSKYSKLDELKLRLSWGKTGNQAITPYQTLSLYNSNYYGNEVGFEPSFLQNKNLIWETTDQYNAGLDIGFFDKKLVANIDVFYKKTNDLLFQENIPSSTGFSTYYSNKGALSNKGFELNLSIDIIRNDKFVWNIYGNYSMYRNRIEELNLPPRPFGNNVFSAYIGNTISAGNTFKTPANIFIEGEQAALFWGFQTNGIINTPEELANAPIAFGIAPQLGDVMIVDQNGDGVINDSDKTIIGNPNPEFTYGFGTNLTYKNLTLNIFFNGVYGNDIANGNKLRNSYAQGTPDNITTDAYYNAYSDTNPNATYPRINYNLVDASGFTDRIIEDGSFLRLSNVSLIYKIPVVKNNYIEGVDFSIAANNLLLFTKYSGYDPEVNSFSFDPLRKGIDWQSFPNQRSFSFGVNVQF